MESKRSYIFMYKARVRGFDWRPSIFLRVGESSESEQIIPGHFMGDDFYLTRVNIPTSVIEHDGLVQFGIVICPSTEEIRRKYDNYHQYSNVVYDLESYDSDTIIYLDTTHLNPKYSEMKERWTTHSAFIMDKKRLDRFVCELSAGPRMHFGYTKSMAFINSTFLERMLKWGTTHGKFLSAPPVEFSHQLQQSIQQMELEEPVKEEESKEEESHHNPSRFMNVLQRMYTRLLTRFSRGERV